MTQDGRTSAKARTQQALMIALMGVIGQVGCLTLVIIVVALIVGLWLDNQFQTRPLFTLILVLASIPLSLFLMFRLVFSFAPRIQKLSSEMFETERGEEPEGDEYATDTT
jgi:D-alanyl-lipoteichoic acid acyltransferase DltB (MBOAT superfamily)